VRRYVTQGDSGGGTSSGAVSRARAKARIRGGEWEPMAPSLAKEGVRDAPVWTTLTCLFAGAFRVRGRETSVSSTFNACRETSRVPASARQSQNVPVSYPRGIGISPLQATLYAHLQGFCASPLTDSNRRPPPYHGSLGASRTGTRDHSRHSFSCKSGRLRSQGCVARRRACRF
jgi:hypothetical protein